MNGASTPFAVIALAILSGAEASSAQWVDTLPPPIQDSILWLGDHEEGSLYDWDYDHDPNAGGCVCNTGGRQVTARATSAETHSGSFAAETKITNAFRARNGNRAVRLMRWTDRHWEEGGDYFPDRAYYSAWFWFPETYNPNKYPPWDPGDGGWWNVFQFKSADEFCESQPLWALNVYHDDDAGTMSFYLRSSYNPPYSFEQRDPLPLPVREWVHVEALYVNSVDSGRITIWQNGQKIISARDVQTSLGECDGAPIWGIGNYTDHIAGGPTEGTATVLFDDAIVSTRRVSRAIDP